MSQQIPDFNAFLAFQKRAMGPFVELGQLYVRSYERAAREGYAVLGEAVEFSIAAAKAAVGAKDAAELAQKQAQLASEFVSKQTSRTHDWVKLAQTTQADYAKWFEAANEELTAATRQSA
jgi:hypothetical protein